MVNRIIDPYKMSRKLFEIILETQNHQKLFRTAAIGIDRFETVIGGLSSATLRYHSWYNNGAASGSVLWIFSFQCVFMYSSLIVNINLAFALESVFTTSFQFSDLMTKWAVNVNHSAICWCIWLYVDHLQYRCTRWVCWFWQATSRV